MMEHYLQMPAIIIIGIAFAFSMEQNEREKRWIQSSNSTPLDIICNNENDNYLVCQCNYECSANMSCCLAQTVESQVLQSLKLHVNCSIARFQSSIQTAFKNRISNTLVDMCGRNYNANAECWDIFEGYNHVIESILIPESIFIFSVSETSKQSIEISLLVSVLLNQSQPVNVPIDSPLRSTLPYGLIFDAIENTPLITADDRTFRLSNITRYMHQHNDSKSKKGRSELPIDIIITCAVLGGLFLLCSLVSAVKAVR